MKYNDLTGDILKVAFEVHSALGPGLMESVYESVLAYELDRHGIRVRRQVPIPIRYRELSFEEGFRADLLVEERVLVELKSVEMLLPVHGKQVLTYLKLGGFKVGLLINFGADRLRDGIERVVNGLVDEAL